MKLPERRFGNALGAHLHFGLPAWASSGSASTAVLPSSLSLKGAGGLTEAWLVSPQTLCTRPTWDQGTCSVGWIQLAPFRTKCSPREATGAGCRPACSSWIRRQDSPPSRHCEFLCFLFPLVFNFFFCRDCFSFLFNYNKEVWWHRVHPVVTSLSCSEAAAVRWLLRFLQLTHVAVDSRQCCRLWPQSQFLSIWIWS